MVPVTYLIDDNNPKLIELHRKRSNLKFWFIEYKTPLKEHFHINNCMDNGAIQLNDNLYPIARAEEDDSLHEIQV